VILDDIVKDKLIEIEMRKRMMPDTQLRDLIETQAPVRDFARALKTRNIGIIAEVKKASPSKGVISFDFNPVSISMIYAASGATAISVLTDEKYFQGKLDYLKEIRENLSRIPVPLLRKDFILDPYQVYESRAYGTDAILLIVAILKPAKLRDLLELTHRLGMHALVEVHNEQEVAVALDSGAEIIGINNRDLTTFKVDLTTTSRLRSRIPSGKIVVSESGIKSRQDIEVLQGQGVNAVLIGETLMAAGDVTAKMRELLGQD